MSEKLAGQLLGIAGSLLFAILMEPTLRSAVTRWLKTQFPPDEPKHNDDVPFYGVAREAESILQSEGR